MNESEGATAIEYGLIASLIAVATMGAVYYLGDTLKWTYFIIALTVLDEKPPPEILAHGGDEEVSLSEYIDMRSKFGDSVEEITYDFGYADQDDNDYLDYDEWIEHKDGPHEP